MQTVDNILLGNRYVGSNYPPLIISDIGINHEGSLDLAITIAESAINAGAEVIKHQTHIVEDEMSIEAKKVIPGNSDISIYEIINKCALCEEDELKLMKFVQQKGKIFISTPFSRAAADRLDRFDIPFFKIGSGECNNYPLVEHIAKKRKPIILSTGMNSIESIRRSVEIFRKYKLPFALLHCTNIYPTPVHLVRLNAMLELKLQFPDSVIGLSDHTENNYSCFGAVALGACILERHFTDSMERPGPDIKNSMDPNSLKDLINGSNDIFSARDGEKAPLIEEKKTIAFAFASIVSIRNIKKGEKLSRDNIWVKRPSGGDFPAQDYELLLGKRASKNIKANLQISKYDVI
jgi:N-acetylneuraminate synthase